MLLYGNGGHAKVILDCLKASGNTIEAFFDDNPTFSSEKDIIFSGLYNPEKFPKKELIISIGNNKIRQSISETVRHAFGKAIHPSVWVSETAKIGSGTVVFHQSIIQADSIVGNHCILNTASIVEHDCKLGDFVHIGPNATICGGVTIGEGTLVGASATVLPNLKVGKWAIIGAGAVVTKNIPDFAVAVGIPAKIIRFVEP